MTEAEWLACTDPQEMLESLAGKASARKLRLFACACCRSVWHLLEERGRTAVRVSERHADGAGDAGELAAARQAAAAAFQEANRVISQANSAASAARVARRFAERAKARGGRTPREAEDAEQVARREAERAGRLAAREEAERGRREAARAASLAAQAAESWEGPPLEFVGEQARSAAEGAGAGRAAQADLLRDLFGNPFRPATRDPARLAPAVLAMAQSIYEEGRFEEVPVLADALEDSGCTDADLLNHLRAPGVHVRGCWALDLCLGKE